MAANLAQVRNTSSDAAMRLLLLILLILGLAAPARGEDFSTDRQIAAEAHYILLDGPGPGEKRGVSVWRPPNAPRQTLPVIYMADGVLGLNVVVERLRPAILAGHLPPMMVVGVASGMQHRHEEYTLPVSGEPSPLFAQYQSWLYDVVMPWAEQHAGASSDPAQRVIGGFSNGADFAIATAKLHPERFAGVLAYSPVQTRPIGFNESATHLRWVITAGRYELNGQIVDNAQQVADAIAAHGGAVRLCIGPWSHRQTAWRDLSPASPAWLFAISSADGAASGAERSYCRNLAA